jgi:hypothetical protein
VLAVKAAIVHELEILLLQVTDLEMMVRQEEDLDPDYRVATAASAASLSRGGSDLHRDRCCQPPPLGRPCAISLSAQGEFDAR